MTKLMGLIKLDDLQILLMLHLMLCQNSVKSQVLQEFKLNPNAKSFTPSQTPVRPLSPVSDGSFYYQTQMSHLPHMHMPVSFGIVDKLRSDARQESKTKLTWRIVRFLAEKCRSCVKKGYMKDDYIHLFVRRPVRRSSPIINRGYFARWAAFRKLLYQFLDCEGSNSEKGKTKRQILSLGAGFDTTYFQLQDEGKAPYLIRGTGF